MEWDNGPRLGGLIGTKLIRSELNVSNVNIGDENEMKVILWGPKRLISDCPQSGIEQLRISLE